MLVTRMSLIGWNAKGSSIGSRMLVTLLPLYTENDGNSMAHSVSMYIFGIHDREQHLRQLIYQMMLMQTEEG